MFKKFSLLYLNIPGLFITVKVPPSSKSMVYGYSGSLKLLTVLSHHTISHLLLLMLVLFLTSHITNLHLVPSSYWNPSTNSFKEGILYPSYTGAVFFGNNVIGDKEAATPKLVSFIKFFLFKILIFKLFCINLHKLFGERFRSSCVKHLYSI